MKKAVQSTVEFLANHRSKTMELFDEKYGFSKKDFDYLYDNNEIFYEEELRRLMLDCKSDLNAEQLEVILQENLSKSFIGCCEGCFVTKDAAIHLKKEEE